MDEQLLQIILQSGAIGTNLVLLYIFFKISMMFNETIRTYFKESNDIRHEEMEAKVKAAELLTHVADVIQGCPARKINKI